MKRVAFQFMWCLLLGAMINVAVAWGCQVRATAQPKVSISQRLVYVQPNNSELEWLRMQLPSIAEIRAEVNRATDFGFRDTRFRVVDPNRPGLHVEWSLQLIRVESGWPLRSLEFTSPHQLDRRAWSEQMDRWRESDSRWRHDPYQRALYVKKDVFGIEIRLPTRPLPAGFAINTIFYAAILWALFAFPGVVRRRIRARRGRCTACGYDLRGASDNNLCPECGANAFKPS